MADFVWGLLDMLYIAGNGKAFITVLCFLIIGSIIGGIWGYCENSAFVMQWGSIIGCGAVGIGIAAWLWKLLR